MSVRAYPVSQLVEQAQLLFRVPSYVAGGALFGHEQGMTTSRASELLSEYLGREVEWTGATPILKNSITFGDGVHSRYTLNHDLEDPTVVAAIWDISVTPPSVVSAEVQQGPDPNNQIIVSAEAWEETPPAANSLVAAVAG